MRIEEARQIVDGARLATEPETLPTLTLPQLREHYDALCKARLVLIQNRYTTTDSNHILQLIRQEIEAKRAEEHNERQHQQAMQLGGKTFFWARVAGLAGIVAVLIALVPILQTYCTNNQHATPVTASPTSLPQTPAPKSESPGQAEDSSTGPTSQPPEVETKPSESPQ